MLGIRIRADGIKKTKNQLGLLASALNDIIANELNLYLNGFLLQRIRLNTPIRTGALRADLRVEKVVVRGNTVRFMIISELPYALRIHEEEFQLGPISREQPAQPEGGVGNKYIERVVNFHANSLKKVLGGLPKIAANKYLRG